MPKRLRTSFWCVCGIEAVELNGAAGGPEQRGQHLDGGGLARAVGAEEGKDLALRHIKRNIVDGGKRAKRLHQVPNPNHWHPSRRIQHRTA